MFYLRRLLLISALASVILAALTPGLAYANGGGTLILERQIGTYNVGVTIIPSSPRIGTLHLSVRLTDAKSGNPVPNTAILVRAQRPGSTKPDVGPFIAESLLNQPLYHDVNVPLDVEGQWTFFLTIGSALNGNPQEEVTLDFPLEVGRAASLSSQLITPVLTGILFLGLLALLIRSAFQPKRT